MSQHLLPQVAAIAGARDYVTTEEFANTLSKRPQTARKLHHEQGHAWGVRPIKVGRNLLWPVAELNKLLGGGV